MDTYNRNYNIINAIKEWLYIYTTLHYIDKFDIKEITEKESLPLSVIQLNVDVDESDSNEIN